MPQVCIYLQLHQPYRLGDFSLFELGKGREYFIQQSGDDNQVIFQKVAQKSYLPMLTVLLELVQTVPDFKVSFSCSGVFLEQAQVYEPRVIELLRSLAKYPKQVEFLAETYYHSLASLYSPSEFFAQVKLHQDEMLRLFGQRPRVFRNTELVYSNSIAELVSKLGFQGMLTEAVPRYLHGRPLTQVFRSLDPSALPLLLKHAQLSDDIAFRFSNRDWASYPLTVDKYLEWVEVYGEDELINLFMDFETFGEHQWADTGIFEFFRHFVQEFLQKKWNRFVTPSQIVAPLWSARHAHDNLEKRSSLPVYDVPVPISWADVDRDLTAWIENSLQQDSLKKIYELEPKLLAQHDPTLLHTWRKLQTSDHFYYMCTKWAADGDVHAYFSPYESPFEAYRRYSVVMADLEDKLVNKQ